MSLESLNHILQEQWWNLCCERVATACDNLDVITKELADEFLKDDKVSSQAEKALFVFLCFRDGNLAFRPFRFELFRQERVAKDHAIFCRSGSQGRAAPIHHQFDHHLLARFCALQSWQEVCGRLAV